MGILIGILIDAEAKINRRANTRKQKMKKNNLHEFLGSTPEYRQTSRAIPQNFPTRRNVITKIHFAPRAIEILYNTPFVNLHYKR